MNNLEHTPDRLKEKPMRRNTAYSLMLQILRGEI